MDDNSTRGPSPALSEKIIALMRQFEGRRLGELPLTCVSSWLDGTLLAISRGRISVNYTVRPEMTNPSGYLHGGIQAAMLDDCLGIVCATLGYDVAALSIDLHVDFLGTAHVGDVLVARAHVLREGERVIYALGELDGDDGEPVARAQSNILISNHPAAFLSLMDRLV